ncbi:hypothetical protein [Longivirga aurantiaca]|uniref:Uncharacterized protein n=1 Tax=Longivirga aurantiaca TaxID=1837743 RepID=A0ABW1T1B0_9ACTN
MHHQVWGILLVLLVGLIEFRYRPESPWAEVLGALFGIGAALALDEFALWLHLEDVYWSEQGQKSIDAVLIAIVVGAALLVGVSPVGDLTAAQEQGFIFTMVFLVTHIGLCILCMLKGKPITGLIGLPVPFFAYVGAIRLAKPTSFWARRWYGPKKMARAEARFAENRSKRMVEGLRDRFSPTTRG